MRLRNMTEGSPAKHIILLALPLMFGNMFQLLYSIVDAVVVGQGVGVDALAALGSADWLNFFVIGTVTGLTQGFSVIFAQKFGANDAESLKKYIANGVVLSIISALVFTVASIAATKPVLRLMGTPEDVLGDSAAYLYIIFGGITAILAYNFAASLLRALGDGRTPLIAMVVASVINIVLDIIFVLVLHWGIEGAAIATVTAQVFSFVICFIRIRRIEILTFTKEDFKVHLGMMGDLLKLGAPVALQNGIIAIGGMFIQSVVNGFGITFIAGYMATNKIYGLLEMAAIAFGYSMTTYTAQNLGAGKIDRIRKGVRSGTLIALATSVLVSLFAIIFGKGIVSMFVRADAENFNGVIDVAYAYLFVMALGLSALYLIYIYRSSLQGMGDTVIPMVSGVVELIMRISVVLIFKNIIGEWAVYVSEVSAWVGSMILLVIVFFIKFHKLVNSYKAKYPE